MSADLIYKTTSGLALQWWAQKEVDDKTYRDAIRTWKDSVLPQFPTPQGEERMILGDSRGIVGIQWCAGDTLANVPEGWRNDKKNRAWVPRLGNKAGIAIDAEISKLRRITTRNAQTIGIPEGLFVSESDGIHGVRPGFECIDGVLYAKLGGESSLEPLKKYWAAKPSEEVVWERVKLSEWYAMQEAKVAQ